MGVLFSWIIPFCLAVAYVQEWNGNLFVGILIFLTAIPLEVLCYRLNKKYEDEGKKKERERRQAWEQERIKAEKERQERIKTSPIKNLSPLEFEEFTKMYLEKRNYKKVELTKTSGDFGADVLAVAPDNKKICVQCKMYSKPVGVSAIQEVHAAKSYYKCERATVVVTSAGFTRQAIQISENVDVNLFAFDDFSREFKPINHCARSFMTKNPF